MAFRDVFDKQQKEKRVKDPLEQLIKTYVAKFRKKKSKNTAIDDKVLEQEEQPLEDNTCKWCEGTGINPKDKKKEKYCRYCGGTGKKQDKKKKTSTMKERLNNTNC